jgi:hypothetical protein
MSEKNIYDYRGLAPDLWRRPVRRSLGSAVGAEAALGDRGLPGFQDRSQPPPYHGEAIEIGKGFQGRAVTVGLTPTLIQQSSYSWPYLILNPSSSTGLTTSGIVFAGNVIAAGNSFLTPVGVGNYLNGHLYLHVTAIVGQWDIYACIFDPITLTWVDSQVLWGGIVGPAPIDLYANIGQFGLGTDFAIRWVPVLPGNLNFQVDYTLKEGVGGSPGGLSLTVYIGANSGITLLSGFPVLEGEHYTVILGENTELWGISAAAVTIRIFEF